MRASLWLSILTAVLLAGCPGKKPPAEEVCNDYEAPASFDSKNPKVSYSRDVIPIFKGSCAFTACHGLQGSNNGVYLGDDTDAVYESVLKRSAELPTMAFVTKGDPRNSYLQRKIDGSHCVLDDQCVDKDCGVIMPKDEDLMPVETRDIIRRWIAQGAQKD